MPPLPIDPEHQPARRLLWVDVARGIGILLVVYGHALRAQVTSGNSVASWYAGVQDEVIYAFHMHLFFFLAGLFVAGSIAKGSIKFIRTKLTTIVYPYVLWSLVSALLGAHAAGATNYDMDLGKFTTIWYKPIYQYWFLYALFVCELVALAARADRWIAGILALMSVVGLLAFLPGMLGVAAIYFPFFFGGVVLAPAILSARIDRRVMAGIAIVASVIFFISFWQSDFMRGFAGEAIVDLLLGILGVATVIAVSMLIDARALWLATVGVASMAIYVMHTIFSAGLRIVLTAVGVQAPTLSLVVCTAIGLIAPLAVWAIAKRFGWLTWLGLGSDASRAKAVRA